MDAGADNRLLPDLDGPGALPGPGLQTRQIFQRRRQGDGLVNGTGGKNGGQEAVHIGPLPAVIRLNVLRNIQRVIAGGGNHAEDLPGLVVVHRHRPGMAVQGLISLVIVPGVKGQGQLPAPVRAKGPVDQIPTRHPVRKRVQRPSPDVPLKVPHSVERRLTNHLAVIVSPLPIFRGGQHIPVPVQHSPGSQLPLAVVKVTVKSGGRPASPLRQIAEEEKNHPRRQRQSQQKANHRPVFNFLHKNPPFPSPRLSSIVSRLSSPVPRPPAGGGGCSRGSPLPP